jgi:phage terminase large subunit GpA-like protein
MYAPTSTSSPRSGPTSGDDDGLTDFDGAGEILRAWGNGLRPDPDLTVSEWADRHRMLSGRASAEPGRYRTVRTPYMREIMDRLSPGDPMQRIVFMKAAQVGATEAGNNWIGFAIHQAPGPMLAVQPTVELAKRNSRQRIDPLIDESPELRERVKPARSRDAGNTMLSKEFAGGILIMTGANSAVGLRSTPARYIFLDEVDAYPASADEEGDPVTLAEARSLTFAHRRKVFLVSTPTIRGLSRIEREYEASDQRRFFVPCPHCDAMQWLKFDRLRWQKGKPETAEYHCEGCDAAIAEHHKTAMLEGGEWRATATAADPTTVGYHLSALYSPIGWLSWERIVRAWDAAQGSDEAIKAFRNTILGETWVETGEAPDWQRLYDRRERWTAGTVPAGGLFLTAGADVQKDRIEVDVWAWGRGLESWLVDHVVIEGGPDRHDAWSELTAMLDRSWPHERGAHLRIARLAIDTGYEAPAVYSWSRAQGFAQVSPVKGVEGFNRSSPVSGPTFVDATEGGKRLRRGARLWTVAVSTFKAETYRFLRLARPTEEDMADGSRIPARLGAPAALGRERMAEAVRRRAAGDGAHEARLRPAGMAEAARAQRGAGLPGLCPRRRLDRRCGSLARSTLVRSRSAARRGEAGPARGRSGDDAIRPDTNDATPADGPLELHGVIHGRCQLAIRANATHAGSIVQPRFPWTNESLPVPSPGAAARILADMSCANDSLSPASTVTA